MPKPNSGGTALATHNDIQGILGDLDPAQLLAILSLRPTVAEPVKGVASDIVTILTENVEEEEPARAG